MVRQLNKEILDKVDEIISYIKNTSEYKEYIKARDLLKEDKELNEIVKNPSKKKVLELKIKSSLDILNNSPLYVEYENLQTEINNMLIIFGNKINKYFNDVFNQVII